MLENDLTRNSLPDSMRAEELKEVVQIRDTDHTLFSLFPPKTIYPRQVGDLRSKTRHISWLLIMWLLFHATEERRDWNPHQISAVASNINFLPYKKCDYQARGGA